MPKIRFIVDPLTKDDGEFLKSHIDCPEIVITEHLKEKLLNKYKDRKLNVFQIVDVRYDDSMVLFKCNGLIRKQGDSNLYFYISEIVGAK